MHFLPDLTLQTRVNMALPSAAVYDCIVIGAGIQGSFTAYHLAKNQKRTLLLEQFPLPHSRGSSHGQSRIIRRAYPEEYYTDMMDECYQLWAELERESGITLYRKTGLLVFAPAGNEEFELVCKNMERKNISWKHVTQEQLKARHPGFIPNPKDTVCCDQEGGVLRADKALRAVQEQFLQNGGVIRDGEKVKHIQPGQLVTVTTTSNIYEAKKIVITAGPWAQKVLSPIGLELPLKGNPPQPKNSLRDYFQKGKLFATKDYIEGLLPENCGHINKPSTPRKLETLRINVCYWKEKNPVGSSLLQNFPAFLSINPNGEEHEVYGLPCLEYPGLVKICFHGGNEADPEERELQYKPPQIPDVQILCEFVSKYIPGLIPEPAIIEQCMYTNTPDCNFILDYHPLHRNIVIGSGFSGHGFKLSPVVGKILSELSMDKQPSYDLTPFRVTRFKTSVTSSL